MSFPVAPLLAPQRTGNPMEISPLCLSTVQLAFLSCHASRLVSIAATLGNERGLHDTLSVGEI